ncbi:two pore domain potassium channel family protein [Thermoleophilia bacterium SCSIO 60948]|nr:two pore domain potassium channel family protein [Thermoleophilia bacterium SCSIO 60948]
MAERRDEGGGAADPYPRVSRIVSRRVRRKGLRPRLAAALIATFWLGAIVVFGIVEHLVDPESFDTIWTGMWWATQTVTTVGYGDVVPDQTAGRIIASFLLIGGLSFFAVITAIITSAFVARDRVDLGVDSESELRETLARVESELAAVRAELGALGRSADRPPGEDPRPGR